MPSDTPDYMAPAWLGCMHWAIGQADIVRDYRTETGDTWKPSPPGTEQHKQDIKTGRADKFCEDFIRWANVAIWGPMN